MSEENLVWVDLEMTGLDPNRDEIIEIALLFTDKDLNIFDEQYEAIIRPSDRALSGMSQKVREMHEDNGLLERTMSSKTTLNEVETEVFSLLNKYIPENRGILAGNSIHKDREFIGAYMKRVHNYLHYRMIDVTSVKELGRRWYPHIPQYEKGETHRALDDIKESIAELEYWRDKVFK